MAMDWLAAASTLLVVFAHAGQLEERRYPTATCDQFLASARIGVNGMSNVSNWGSITTGSEGAADLVLFAICLDGPPALTADLNGDGEVTAADWDLVIQLETQIQQQLKGTPGS